MPPNLFLYDCWLFPQEEFLIVHWFKKYSYSSRSQRFLNSQLGPRHCLVNTQGRPCRHHHLEEKAGGTCMALGCVLSFGYCPEANQQKRKSDQFTLLNSSSVRDAVKRMISESLDGLETHPACEEPQVIQLVLSPAEVALCTLSPAGLDFPTSSREQSEERKIIHWPQRTNSTFIRWGRWCHDITVPLVPRGDGGCSAQWGFSQTGSSSTVEKQVEWP